MSDPASPAEPRPGLRERKKAKTRNAIQEHALRLFREQGYARTTVEQIAEAAEVSPSTFFRYFPTKEDVVLYDALDPLLIEAMGHQPLDLQPLEAMRRAMHEVWGTLKPGALTDELDRGRLVYTVPELRERYLVELIRTTALMAGIAAARLGRDPDDFEVRVAAGAAMGGLLAALLPIIERSEGPEVLMAMDRVVDLLERGLRF
jgi:AcrR family transcriptional regulator